MKRGLAVATVVLLAASTALAVKTRLWEITNEAEFNKGTLENVIVSSEGAVFLGRKVTELKSEDKGIWSSTVAPDGTLYLGTGESGKVLRLEGEKLVTAGETKEMTVTSLVTDATGTVYAATIPNGKIFRLAPGKELELFATLPVPNVWCLAFAADGALYAGTGPKGKLFRVDADGKAQELYATKSENILCLRAGEAGELYFGTAKPGVVYRRTPDGKVRGLLDLGTHEVRAIAVAKGEVTVAANQPGEAAAAEGGGGGGAAAVLKALQAAKGGAPGGMSVEIGGGDDEGDGPGDGKAQVTPDAKGGQGALYRIDARGASEEIYRLENGMFSSVAAAADGSVFAASSSAGKVFHFLPENVNYTLLSLPGRQALTLAVENGDLRYVGMSNPGGVFRVEKERAEAGSYLSEVFDARFVADWGRLHWVGTGKLAFATRSGNSAAPDETWSDWTEAVAGNPVPVACPPGRFLQFKAAWSQDREATLRVVRVGYLVQNQRPRVTAVTLAGGEGGDEEEKPASGGAAATTLSSALSHALGDAAVKVSATKDGTASPGAHKLHQQAGVTKKISWTAEDADGDTLAYRLWYAPQGTSRWIPLTRENPIDETSFDWSTESVPDGYYLIKVEATDEKSNPKEVALKSAKVSAPILVDNTRPVVRDLVVVEDPPGTPRAVAGVADDGASLVDRIEYSVDGSPWQSIWPEGKLTDSAQAAFRIPVEGLAPGDHVVAVRAVDLAGNVGVAVIGCRGR